MRTNRFLPLAAVLVASACANPAVAARTVSLGEAVALATQQATTAKLGDLAGDRASARAAERRGALLPQVTGTVARTSNATFGFGSSFGFAAPNGDADQYDARVGVTQTLFDWSRWMEWRAADTEREAFDASGTHAREEAATSAAQSALGVARTSATVAAREADLALAEDLLAIAVTRRAAGTAADIDVTRARTQVAAARGDVVMARTDRTQAGIELARSLGLEAGAGVALSDSLDESFAGMAAPATLDEALSHAQSKRPDLATAETRRESARQSLSAARGEWIPAVDLIADAGWTGSSADHLDDAHRVGVQLRWSIADGFAREARIADRTAATREADVAAADATQRVQADVREAWAALSAGQTLVEVATERERLAMEEVAQARLKLQEGLGGNLDVIEAQSSLVRARDAVIDARARTAAARIDLARAMGMAAEIR